MFLSLFGKHLEVLDKSVNPLCAKHTFAAAVDPHARTKGFSNMQTIKLLSRRKAAPTLFVLEFERPADYSFRAGQFARLGMELEPGQSVLLDGPAEGSLTPDRIPGGSTLWLLATGSGLSPFASMLRSEAFWAAWKDVVLVLSVRQIEEAVLARELVAALPLERRPKLIVTTTRETDPARFGDLTGRIPTLIASGALEAAAERQITPEESRVLLCGNPDFIAAARAELKLRGLVSPRFGKPGQLVVENFW